MSTSTDPTPELELWLRAFSPSISKKRQRELIERARSLAADGVVDDVEVDTWSSQVCTPDDDATDAIDTCPAVVGELLNAVEGTDLRLEPHFGHRDVAPDRWGTVISLPVVCLLVRQDGELVGIYPATDDERSYSVTDGLERLEAGEPVANLRTIATA